MSLRHEQSEKTKSFSNVQDIRVKTPHLLYENKVWSFEDLASVMRRGESFSP
jgi:hypothetical protein